MLRSLALRRSPYVVLAVAAITLTLLVGGWKAAAGIGLGLAGAAFNLIVLWWTLGLLGRSMANRDISRPGASIMVLGFFLKLPLYIVLGIATYKIGNPAPGCFLAGVGLVYFCLVGWALAKS